MVHEAHTVAASLLYPGGRAIISGEVAELLGSRLDQDVVVADIPVMVPALPA